MANTKTIASSAGDFGPYLKQLREGLKMSLRDVETATEKEVSNGYLSQLENGKILTPSPNILHALATLYSADYSNLMERAGYISAFTKREDSAKHGKAATFAVDHLTKDEESELREYLAFIRSKRKDSS